MVFEKLSNGCVLFRCTLPKTIWFEFSRCTISVFFSSSSKSTICRYRSKTSLWSPKNSLKNITLTLLHWTKLLPLGKISNNWKTSTRKRLRSRTKLHRWPTSRWVAGRRGRTGFILLLSNLDLTYMLISSLSCLSHITSQKLVRSSSLEAWTWQLLRNFSQNRTMMTCNLIPAYQHICNHSQYLMAMSDCAVKLMKTPRPAGPVLTDSYHSSGALVCLSRPGRLGRSDFFDFGSVQAVLRHDRDLPHGLTDRSGPSPSVHHVTWSDSIL